MLASPAQQRPQPAVAPPPLVDPPLSNLGAAAPSQPHGGAVGGPSSQGQGSGASAASGLDSMQDLLGVVGRPVPTPPGSDEACEACNGGERVLGVAL
jgi:hypothetical protein